MAKQNILNDNTTWGSEATKIESNFSELYNEKVDKTSVVQTTGASLSDVMSQKAVTDELALKADQTELDQLAGDLNKLSIDIKHIPDSTYPDIVANGGYALNMVYHHNDVKFKAGEDYTVTAQSNLATGVKVVFFQFVNNILTEIHSVIKTGIGLHSFKISESGYDFSSVVGDIFIGVTPIANNGGGRLTVASWEGWKYWNPTTQTVININYKIMLWLSTESEINAANRLYALENSITYLQNIEKVERGNTLTYRVPKSIFIKDGFAISASYVYYANANYISTAKQKLPENWGKIRVRLSSTSRIGFIETVNINAGSFNVIVLGNYKPEIFEFKKEDYPEANWFFISYEKSDLDNFFCEIECETKSGVSRTDAENYQGIEDATSMHLFAFNETNYTNIGALKLDGTIDISKVDYRTCNFQLIENWKYLLVDLTDNNTTGIILYDKNKQHLGYIFGNVKGNYTTKLYRKDFQNAVYFRHSYKVGQGDASVRIFNTTTKITDGRIFNPYLLNINSFNAKYPNSELTEEIAFDAANETMPYVRTPTLFVTNAGSVLVAINTKMATDDKSPMDVKLGRKSVTGVWTYNVILPYNLVTYGRGMNFSFVQDLTGAHGVLNRIFFFVSTVKDPNKMAVSSPYAELDLLMFTSDDDGATWSSATSLKQYWNAAAYQGALNSPANGIQIADGTLVIPSMVVNIANSGWVSGLFYKKQDSSDWVFSETTAVHQNNESAVVEREDNEVILNVRTEKSTRDIYKFKFETNSFEKDYTNGTFLPYLNCQMSLHKIKNFGTYNPKQTIYLMTQPDVSDVLIPNPDNSRRFLTIWMSLDMENWIRVFRATGDELSMGYQSFHERNGIMYLAYEVPRAISCTQIAVIDLTNFKDELELISKKYIYYSYDEKLSVLMKRLMTI